MKASEFVTEKKKRRKRKPRWAAYGPGPYGGYGFATGYSGDGGGAPAGDGGGAGGESIEFDEGIKDTLWNLGISAAIAAGGVGAMTIKQALTSPSIPTETKIEIIQQAKLKKDDIPKLIAAVKQETPKQAAAKPAPVKKKIDVKAVTDNPLEKVLLKTAKAAGIHGAELAAFMAQCAHETMDFKSLKEFGGSLDFRKYDPKYAPKKAKALGNKKVGDGARYKGRGYIQLTGRYNYKKAGDELGLPLEKHPELVEKPEVAAKVAVWFWQHRVQPNVDNFNDVNAVTKPINPSMNGLQDRKQNFKDYMQVAMN